VALNPSGRNKNGTVGPPIPGTEVRIGPDGEILVRGPGVTNGYYGDSGATRAAFVDGWFATGDVGRLDEEGFLIITDRKKELIVSSGGKKIAPAPLERRLESDPLIAQAMVIGDRRQFLSALLVPEFAALEREARARGMRFADRRDLVGLPEVHSLYEQRLAEVGKDLAPYEQIRRFTLLAKEWSAESGEITPTLKVKRRVVEERYRDLIERMYTSPAPEAPSLRRS
jgi:long-chain acyl-CoA synthetase